MLRWRERERSAIAQLLHLARAGRGGGLLLEGEPGIGKSALLADARDQASDMRVLHATCIENESSLAYAMLEQLLRPVRKAIDNLPAPQHEAFSIALGLQTGNPPDRFLVSLAALTLLSEFATDQPILCLIDDAQWSDAPSLEVLRFVIRRLDAEPIAVVASVRAGEGRDLLNAGMRIVPVAGLPKQDAAALLEARWENALAPHVRDQLIATTRGNPLALVELSRSLTAEQRAGLVPLPRPIPLGGQLETIYTNELNRLEPDSRSIALVCAVAGHSSVAIVDMAAAGVGARTSLLESRGLEQILRIENETVDFAHPLMRTAAYQSADPRARRAAHLAVADALAAVNDQADRVAWHRADAALGPDEEIAHELECAAGRTLQRSGYAAAADALERAAELSPSERQKVRRLVGAAEAAWHAGDPARARHAVERAERLGLGDASVLLRARYVQGSVELRSGIPADGLALLLAAVKESGAADPQFVVRVLAVAGEASFQSGEASDQIGALLAALPTGNGDRGQRLLACGYRAIDAAAAPGEIAMFRQELTSADELEDLDVLIRVAGLAFGVGELAAARRLWNRAAARARTLGAAGLLASVLRPLALNEMYGGRFAWAEASSAEGRALALETGQPNLALQHAALLAELAGIRGREKEARELADEVLREAATRGLQGTVALMRRALGQLCLAVGRPEEAIGHLEALWSLNASSHRAIALGVIPYLVEAAVRAGRPSQAQSWFQRLVSIEEGTFPEARALVMRCRGLVSSGFEADASFQAAVSAHSALVRPLDHARTLLLYGEYLRRERRRIEAREPLRTAMEACDRLGAVLWAERARTELRATGETARKRESNSFDQLTRQELQVLRAVSQGTTNREVAAQLFISPRTVDHHLRSIFQKLGISSRSELIRLAMSD